MNIQQLYKQLILDHNKHPQNFGELQQATHTAEGYNPLCGDHYWVHVVMDHDKIKDIRFSGEGCAISKASASIMTEEVKGMSLKEIAQLTESFHNIITGKSDEPANEYIQAFAGVSAFPTRTKCAALPWHTLKAALTNSQNPVKTE